MCEYAVRGLTIGFGKRAGRGAEAIEPSVPREFVNSGGFRSGGSKEEINEGDKQEDFDDLGKLQEEEKQDFDRLEKLDLALAFLLKDPDSDIGNGAERVNGDINGDISEIKNDGAAKHIEKNLQNNCVMGRGGGLPGKSNIAIGSDEEIFVSGVLNENRNFLTIRLAGEKYKALLDPGAMISLVGPKISERFRSRLRPNNTMIRAVTGAISEVLGVLDVNIEIDFIEGQNACILEQWRISINK